MGLPACLPYAVLRLSYAARRWQLLLLVIRLIQRLLLWWLLSRCAARAGPAGTCCASRVSLLGQCWLYAAYTAAGTAVLGHSLQQVLSSSPQHQQQRQLQKQHKQQQQQ